MYAFLVVHFVLIVFLGCNPKLYPVLYRKGVLCIGGGYAAMYFYMGSVISLNCTWCFCIRRVPYIPRKGSKYV